MNPIGRELGKRVGCWGHQPEGGTEAADPRDSEGRRQESLGALGIRDLSSLPAARVWQDLPEADQESRARRAQVGLEEGSRVPESSTGSLGPWERDSEPADDEMGGALPGSLNPSALFPELQRLPLCFRALQSQGQPTTWTRVPGGRAAALRTGSRLPCNWVQQSQLVGEGGLALPLIRCVSRCEVTRYLPASVSSFKIGINTASLPGLIKGLN